jgi:glutathionylspermidine synthase
MLAPHSKPYSLRRSELYDPLRRDGSFTWDYMEGQEYALAGCMVIDEAFRYELARATDSLGRIFTKTVEVVQNGEEGLLLGLGLPPETIAAARLPLPGGMLTAVGRFDFARTPDGLKMLEFNCDTPTGVVEAALVNGAVCDYYGLADPNASMNGDISAAFQRLKAAYHKLGYPTEQIVFSALDWHDEDTGTTRYLLKQSGLDGRFVPLASLRVDGDRLCVSDECVVDGEQLQPVDLLYRLHPLEKLAEDQDEDGYPTGIHALDLIAAGHVAIINPPAAFIAQSKALQALIWGLHESGSFFTKDEHAMIDRYMLPTYLENRFAGVSGYVVKPIYGREGGGITLYTANGQLLAHDEELRYSEQLMVYQQLAELEQADIETEAGAYRGHLLWGSFWIGEKPSGILARVGGRITGNLAYYLPVGIS